MNVVIYARFSSHTQTEQSIEGQLKVCYEYAKAHQYTVIGEYIDRAQSGTTDNRTDFQRMSKTVRSTLSRGFSSISWTVSLETATTVPSLKQILRKLVGVSSLPEKTLPRMPPAF